MSSVSFYTFGCKVNSAETEIMREQFASAGYTLMEGADADVVVFDPDDEWIVNVADLKTKAGNSPYGGEKMRGRVALTIVSGEVVYRGGEILKSVAKPY